MGIRDWFRAYIDSVDPSVEAVQPPSITSARTEGSELYDRGAEPQRLYKIDVLPSPRSAGQIEVFSVRKDAEGLTVECLLTRALDSAREIPVYLPAGKTSWLAARTISASGTASELSDPWEVPPVESDRLVVCKRHFQKVLDNVKYPNFTFTCGLSGEALYLQISCSGKCNVTGGDLDWKSGKWLLSEHMLDSEIVQKALKATLTAIEHEARELFTYRGRAIFDPHFDVDRLWALRGEAGAVVQRKPPAGANPSESLSDTLYKITGLPTVQQIQAGDLNSLYVLEENTAPRAADCDNPGAIAIVANRNVQNRIRELGGVPRFDKFGHRIT